MKNITTSLLKVTLFATLQAPFDVTSGISPDHFGILKQACLEARYQYRHQKTGGSPSDIKEIFKLGGLMWPVWKPANPNDNIDLIVKTSGWGTGNPDYGAGYQESVKYFQKIADDDRIIMQKTHIMFSTPSFSGNFQYLPDSAEIARFKIRESSQDLLWYKKYPTLKDPYKNWEYILVSDTYNKLVHNTPISNFGTEVSTGELGEIDGEIVIFTDSGSFQEEFVQIPPGTPGYQDTEMDR